ncbi:MAG: putative ABC transporter permease [Lachnospiraceae bacterium]
MTVLQFILVFFIFSFVGWVYESVLCSEVKYHKLINRGFLMGPYCPIYGAGIILNWLILSKTENLIAIFFTSAVVCCIVEYVASYFMELLFHARWWDYSQIPFNLNGRVCLFGGIVFGLGNLGLIKFAYPFTLNLLNKMSVTVQAVAAIILCFIFIMDIIITTKNASKFTNKVQQLRDKASEFTKAVTGGKAFTHGEKRFLKAFPNFHSKNYQSIIEKIKEYL